MKILVVDDNKDDRKLLRSIAERNGHEVLEAVDGREGLERAAASMPDLIISDVLMPVMDGFQFLIHMKKNETLKLIPFIFYSATYTEEQDMQLGLSLGADAYIVKPKDPVELWQEVESTVLKAGEEKAIAIELIGEEEDYLRKYSERVNLKLEHKIRLLEESQRSYKILSEDLSRIVKELSESEKKFKDLTERSPVGVYVLQDEVFKYLNPRFSEIFGYTARELTDKGCANIILPDDLPLVENCVRKRLAGEEEYGHYPLRGLKKNGELIYLEVYSSRTMYEGNPAIIGTLLDITERKNLERELQESKDFLENIMQNVTNAIFVVDLEGRFVEFNRAASELTGYGKEDAVGKPFSILFDRDALPGIEECFIKVTVQGEPVRNCEAEIVHKDGSRRIIIWSAVPLVKAGRIIGCVSAGQDITERKRMEESMRYLAHHDPLTDLPNRRLFADIIGIECARARRHKTRMALLFMDLDRFKEVNDTLGHDIGDRLLRETAARLKAHVRESDTISRAGGDEFNIILANIVKVEDIGDVVRKIVESFRKPFSIAGHELYVTTSIGISIYPEDSDDIDTLFRYADIAMYYAKEQGRNTFQFYNPTINLRSLERIDMEGRLRQAIERGEFVVYYQPQVNIISGRMVCSEALVRWRHPELGFLAPNQFIPMAEDTGFITAIDEYVLRTACAQLGSWMDAGLPPFCVTVNLSAREFQDSELVTKIERILKETGAPPDCLNVEITENLAMSNIECTVNRLNELAEIGVHTSIDDFGTGYSSLNYLKKLPIEKLNIDQSFVRNLTASADDRVIISAVTAMAHTMKMKVLAEGVETEEQLSFLRSIGCEEMQGYLFSEPVPAGEIREMMAVAG